MRGLLGVFGLAAGGSAGYLVGIHTGDAAPVEVGRCVVAFTGELYNSDRVRQLLVRDNGVRFATPPTDPELVAAAHQVWGTAAAERLRGMFGYVVWDRGSGLVTAVRDRFGVVPLYYATTGASLLVATEKRALLPLLAAVGGSALDPAGVAGYLSERHVPEPRTMHRGLDRLPAGSVLRWTADADVTVDRYWRPVFHPDPDRSAQPQRLHEAVRDSVRVRMQGTGRIGVLLTDGADPAGLVALARAVAPATVTFGSGVSHTDVGVEQVPITAEDVVAELPALVARLDDPVADPILVPLHFLCRAAADVVDVALWDAGAVEMIGRRRAGGLLRRRAERPAVGPAREVELGRLPGGLLTAAARLSAVHHVRLRTPCLDPVVFDVAARLRPTRRAAAAGPPIVPVAAWLRDAVGEWADLVFAASGAGDLVDLAATRRLLAEHRRGRADHAERLWAVLVFCLWHASLTDRQAGFTNPPRATERWSAQNDDRNVGSRSRL